MALGTLADGTGSNFGDPTFPELQNFLAMGGAAYGGLIGTPFIDDGMFSTLPNTGPTYMPIDLIQPDYQSFQYTTDSLSYIQRTPSPAAASHPVSPLDSEDGPDWCPESEFDGKMTIVAARDVPAWLRDRQLPAPTVSRGPSPRPDLAVQTPDLNQRPLLDVENSNDGLTYQGDDEDDEDSPDSPIGPSWCPMEAFPVPDLSAYSWAK